MVIVYLFNKKFLYNTNSAPVWLLINKMDTTIHLQSIGEVCNSIQQGYLFFFKICFRHFKSSSGSKLFVLLFPLVFIVAIVLIVLWFILIPGFVSVNVQFKLIFFYESVFCVLVFIL